jgi:uncharacterized SAM-binding protein YcdF (DUF218 family)
MASKPLTLIKGRSRKARRGRFAWPVRLVLACAGIGLALLAWAALARHFAPASNTSLTRFDAILVLGTSADSDGNPTPDMLARVTEAVHEYERGIAPRVIFSGGPTRHGFIEARVMARTAHAQGMPDSAILEEPRALDTIQNACYTQRILNAHGWTSAEVITTPQHAPRAAMILDRYPLEWSMHTAQPLEEQSAAYGSALSAVETLKTVRYLIWARWAEQCQP